MQGLVGGRDSVSKYCLQRSPVPTIVVRPSSKRTKKKLKRQAEQGRSVYSNILTKAQTVGGRHVADRGSVALALLANLLLEGNVPVTLLLGLLELPRQGAEEDVRALCAQRVVELRPAREQAEEPQ